MNDIYLTIIGNVVAPPRMRMTKSGHAVTNFRVASTSRRKDRETGEWVDNATLYVTVTCWRNLAENVAASLQKGQPVVVTGRYYSREYVVDEVVRVSYELEAVAVGHDLSRGSAEFRKVFRPSGAVVVERDADGIPVDDSDHWFDLASGDEGEQAETEPAQELAHAS